MQARRVALGLSALFAFCVACGSSDDGEGGAGDPTNGSGDDDIVGAGPDGGPGGEGSTSDPLAAPPFDPLTRCSKLDPNGAASPYARPVVTARVRTTKPTGVTLFVEGKSGDAYGVREGAAGPEIVRRRSASDLEVLASGNGTAEAPGEWMLRLDVSDAGVRGKAWPANSHEPAAWQVTWKGAPPAIAKISLAAAADADPKTSYVLAGPATAAGIDDDALHSYVSCKAPMPSVGPPADGKIDDAGDTKNKAEIAGLMRWALAKTNPLLVAIGAGTSNTIDGDVQACADGPMCIRRRFEGTELAYAALRTAGYTDEEIADRRRVRFVMWGFGNTGKDKDLVFHTNGAGDAKPFVVHNLGGENAAMRGPDGAPAANPVPFAGTFAYTKQHADDDANRMRDAVEAYAKTAPGFGDHTLIVGHSWGAAFTTVMALEKSHAFHIDLAMTVAMPKVAADLNALVPCSASLLTGNCPNITPKLDLEQGFYVGPGAMPLYRIDRPDDPVANARDFKSTMAMVNDVRDGMFAGHDYVIRKATPAPAKAQCTRTYQQCAPGGIACSTKHETVAYFSKKPSPTYVGMYGIDSFHIECTIGGAIFEYRCDGIGPLASTYCKSPPGSSEKICAAKPSDCP